MKTIINKTHAPLKVPLPRGKALHLGPSKSGQIADGAAEHAGVQRLLKAGKIEIFDGGETPRGPTGEAAAAHEASHGHPHASIRKSGDR